jgi:cytochrome bd-type quinol oxidase subunit 1
MQRFARLLHALEVAAAGLQVFILDILYGTMLKHQPSKMQAAEGFWETKSQSPAPYYWIIVPDQRQHGNRFAFGTSYLGSIWLTHSLDGTVEGLKNTPPDRQPLMGMVFCGFRIMYCTAMLMSGIVLIAFPNIVRFRLSLWEAAAGSASQTFLLAGAIVVTPVILGYSAFAYWIFRGRTPEKGWAE